MQIICPVCQIKFKRNSSTNKYCSPMCGNMSFLSELKRDKKETTIELVNTAKNILFKGLSS